MMKKTIYIAFITFMALAIIVSLGSYFYTKNILCILVAFAAAAYIAIHTFYYKKL